MLTLVIIKNPFEPWNGREVKRILAGETLQQVLSGYTCSGLDIQATVNGVNVKPDTVLKNGDFVVIYPQVGKSGKNILAMVAMVALSVAAGGITSAGWKIGGMTIKAGTLGAYMAATAVMFIGSSLIGRIAGQRADMGGFGENSATYSWGGIRTMEGQNNAIAVTYGTVQSGGQSIAKNISVIDNDEYLNWLVAAGEGPLQISDIQINENPISYYEGMTAVVREGTNTQAVISHFNDTYFTKSLDYQLLGKERIDTVQGNATEGIIVKVEFNAGLYYAKNDGGLGEAWVEILGYYRKTDGEWIRFIGHMEDVIRESENPEEPPVVVGQQEVGERITGSQSSALRKEFHIDGLEPGQYEIKMKVSRRSHGVTNSRASVRCWWTAITSIVYDDFSYPNIALIGIHAKATDQISGNPQLKFKKTRPYILAYNPYSAIYEQKNSNNPAWAAYDMLHQCTRLENVNTGEFEYEVRGVGKEQINYDQFSEWAAFCEEKRLYINLEISTLGEMLDVINRNIANIGRGMVVRFGTKYGCVWDCAKQPVQMFGMGNIVAGSFEETFLPTNDRANAVEVTYTDADNGFNRETIVIFGKDYDETLEEKVAQATFNGITSYEQAYREGMYQLYCNAYQIRAVSFEADIDAIACTVGDVVLIAHDVPKWAKSGRIYQIEGQVLTLPVELSETDSQYRIMYRTIKDVLHSSNVEILSNGDGWCKVRVETIFDQNDMPNANDIFDLAIASVGSKPFIVKSISRAQDFKRKIECIEYNENLYAENYDIPEIQYSSADQTPQNVTSLSARKYSYIDANSTVKWKIDVSWNRTSAGTFDLYQTTNGTTYNLLAGNLRESVYIGDIAQGVIGVKIVTVNGKKQSSGTVKEVENIDTLIQSLKITNITSSVVMSGDSAVVTVSWDPLNVTNLKYYIIEFRGSEYKTINLTAEFGGVPEGQYSLSVKAVLNDDTHGEATTATINVTKDVSNLAINNLIANVTLNGTIGNVALTWADIDVTVLRCYVAELDNQVFRTINPSATFENVPKGTYVAKVYAINTSGQKGADSTVQVTI